MTTRELGKLGEDYASLYLAEHGYRIISCNIYQNNEEIDIIAEKGNVRVFVEVKARSQVPGAQAKYGLPCQAVTPKKRLHILSAARKYNRAHETKKEIRFDVIEVYISKNEPIHVMEVRHLEDVFHA